jgi:hypothetical protein
MIVAVVTHDNHEVVPRIAVLRPVDHLMNATLPLSRSDLMKEKAPPEHVDHRAGDLLVRVGFDGLSVECDGAIERLPEC